MQFSTLYNNNGSVGVQFTTDILTPRRTEQTVQNGGRTVAFSQKHANFKLELSAERVAALVPFYNVLFLPETILTSTQIALFPQSCQIYNCWRD